MLLFSGVTSIPLTIAEIARTLQNEEINIDKETVQRLTSIRRKVQNGQEVNKRIKEAWPNLYLIVKYEWLADFKS